MTPGNIGMFDWSIGMRQTRLDWVVSRVACRVDAAVGRTSATARAATHHSDREVGASLLPVIMRHVVEQFMRRK